LGARPGTHSTKRCRPQWVKPRAKSKAKAYQVGQSGVACMGHLRERDSRAATPAVTVTDGALPLQRPASGEGHELLQRVRFSE
jgi:hypothetical protein